MGKWICKVCGYTHQGAEAPERCPQCGASKSEFHGERRSNGCSFSFWIIILLLAASILSIFGCSSRVTVDNTTVKTLDLS